MGTASELSGFAAVQPRRPGAVPQVDAAGTARPARLATLRIRFSNEAVDISKPANSVSAAGVRPLTDTAITHALLWCGCTRTLAFAKKRRTDGTTREDVLSIVEPTPARSVTKPWTDDLSNGKREDLNEAERGRERHTRSAPTGFETRAWGPQVRHCRRTAGRRMGNSSAPACTGDV